MYFVQIGRMYQTNKPNSNVMYLCLMYVYADIAMEFVVTHSLYISCTSWDLVQVITLTYNLF